MKSCLVLFSVLLVSQASVVPKDPTAAEITRNGNLNRYYLYTRSNRDNYAQLQASTSSVSNSAIEFSRDTAIIIHGQHASAFDSLNPTVKDAFLDSGDVNVIVVDWSHYADQYYSSASDAVPSIADGVTNFINILVNTGKAELGRIHIVGFDLGAHVAGFTGRNLNGGVARITGLDPTSSRWGSNSGRLNANDARFVEVIHTDSRGLMANGISDAIGDMDFYPNNGGNQPGCLIHNCSHNRAWELFAASLKYNHFVSQQCTGSSNNNCNGPVQWMGNTELTKSGSGRYGLSTGRSYPF